MRRLALAALAALLTACSAGVGGDWPDPPKGVLADCHALGDRCGGSGWCGATEDDRLTCCPVPLRDGVYCPGTDPAVTECEVDADCPRQECHEKATCMGGVCFAKPLRELNPCDGGRGVCSASGECRGCASDDECESANVSECYSGTCGNDGNCQFAQKSAGAACHITPNATCDAAASCIPD